MLAKKTPERNFLLALHLPRKKIDLSTSRLWFDDLFQRERQTRSVEEKGAKISSSINCETGEKIGEISSSVSHQLERAEEKVRGISFVNWSLGQPVAPAGKTIFDLFSSDAAFKRRVALLSILKSSQALDFSPILGGNH